MLKVKMLARHTSPFGKMEPGHEYLLPYSYAMELIGHGLADYVMPDVVQPPVNVSLKPTKTKAMHTALKEMRAKNQAKITGKK